MSARHRRPVPPRRINKRVVGAGASGLAVVFAVVPFASADEPVDPTTSAAPAEAPGPAPSSDVPPGDVPTSDAPTGATPTPDVPTGDVPSSDAPTGDVPISPSSDVPSPDAPAPSTPAATSPAASTDASVAPKQAKRADPVPNYGNRKITVSAQLDGGDYYPVGTTTAGSTFRIVETGPTVPDGSTTTTCTSAVIVPPPGVPAPDPTSSDCYDLFSGYQPAAASTVTITQLTARPNTVVDPTVFTSVPCVAVANPGFPTVPLCVAQDSSALFTDAGLPPLVTDDDTTVTVPVGESTTVDVDEQQVDPQGAPLTSVDVTTEPAHGTVTVVSDAPPPPLQGRAAVALTGPFHFVYTPADGYAGPDSFAYSLSTANGTAGPVTVNLRVVGDAPTARDDAASTGQGDAVVQDVLANDDANGGGTLAVGAVNAAQHGSTVIVDGKIRYTPAADFAGTDTFGYTATTYSGTDTATVTVTVRAAAPPTTPTTTPTTSPTTAPPTTPTTAPTTAPTTNGNGAAPAGDDVTTADTGVPSAALLGIGGSLLLAGAGATVVGRRRRPTGGHA